MSAPPVEQLTDDQVLQRWRQIETDRRRLEREEAALIGQVRIRGLAFSHGCKDEVDFARHLLTIGARDAAGG